LLGVLARPQSVGRMTLPPLFPLCRHSLPFPSSRGDWSVFSQFLAPVYLPVMEAEGTQRYFTPFLVLASISLSPTPLPFFFFFRFDDGTPHPFEGEVLSFLLPLPSDLRSHKPGAIAFLYHHGMLPNRRGHQFRFPVVPQAAFTPPHTFPLSHGDFRPVSKCHAFP